MESEKYSSISHAQRYNFSLLRNAPNVGGAYVDLDGGNGFVSICDEEEFDGNCDISHSFEVYNTYGSNCDVAYDQAYNNMMNNCDYPPCFDHAS